MPEVSEEEAELLELINQSVDPEILEIIELCNSLANHPQLEYEVTVSGSDTDYAYQS